MYVFVSRPRGYSAEWTGQQRRRAAIGEQRSHVDTNQLLWLKADKVRERAIHPQHVAGLIVCDHKVGNGVKNFDPVTVGLLHPGKEPPVLQRDGSLSGDGLQQLRIV